MFYLRINKVKFLKNRELIGKAEIQFLSFVNAGEADFLMMKEFFSTNDEQKKNELVEVYKHKKDDQAGLLLTSFIEKEDYPLGKRDSKERDLSGNMLIDYSIFAYNE